MHFRKIEAQALAAMAFAGVVTALSATLTDNGNMDYYDWGSQCNKYCTFSIDSRGCKDTVTFEGSCKGNMGGHDVFHSKCDHTWTSSFVYNSDLNAMTLTVNNNERTHGYQWKVYDCEDVVGNNEATCKTNYNNKCNLVQNAVW